MKRFIALLLSALLLISSSNTLFADDYGGAPTTVYSSDGKTMAYSLHKDGKDVLVLNGKETATYDTITENSLYFYNNTLFLTAKIGEKYALVVDGKVQKTYEYVSMPYHIASGDYAYTASNGSTYYYVYNGTEIASGDFISVNTSYEGTYLYASVQKYDDPTMMTSSTYTTYINNSQLAPELTDVVIHGVSKNGKKVYYIGAKDGKYALYMNGKKLSKDYDGVDGYWKTGNPASGKNPEDFVSVFMKGDKYVLTRKWRELGTYDSISYVYYNYATNALIKQVVKNEKSYFSIGDAAWGPFDSIDSLNFSSDGKLWTAFVKRGNESFVIVNGNEIH